MKKAKRISADIVFLRDEAPGCEVVLDSGDSVAYPVHWHAASVVIGLVRSGRVRLARGGRSEWVRAGEVFVIPPHQAHSLSADAPYAMASLCLDAAACRAAEAVAPAAKDRLDALRDRLVAAPGRYPDLAGMAEAAHVCPRHFVRLFRERYGVPPCRYQKQSRLRIARRELAAGGHSLAQVALRAGFFDQSHFIREFKKRYCMTPFEYQRALRLLNTAPA